MENNNGYINGGFERNESHLIRDPPKCEPCGFEGHEWY
jgi:predicted Zn-ribbon and HTH transcriptional regulator